MSKINMQLSANGNIDSTRPLPSSIDSLSFHLQINCYRCFYVSILGIRSLVVTLLGILIFSGIFVHDMFDEWSPTSFSRETGKESKIISEKNHKEDKEMELKSSSLPIKRVFATVIVVSFVYLTIKVVIGWLAMLTLKKKYLHLSLALECMSLFLCGYIMDPLKSLCALVIVSIQGVCILCLIKVIKFSSEFVNNNQLKPIQLRSIT